MTRSYGPPGGAAPSAHDDLDPLDARGPQVRRAASATSGWMSTAVTVPSGPARSASSAALKPVPAPISSTRSPGRTSSRASIAAIRLGWLDELVGMPSGPVRVTTASSA